MPWASVSYWGQTGTKQGPNLAGSNLRGGFSRLIWTGNIWIIHHQHLPPHLLQLNNFGGLWAIQTSFTVKYPNSNLMCQIDFYIFCISRGGIQLLPSSAAIVIVAPLRQSWLDKLQPLPSFLPPASQMSPTRLNFRRKPSIRRRLWIWNINEIDILPSPSFERVSTALISSIWFGKMHKKIWFQVPLEEFVNIRREN